MALNFLINTARAWHSPLDRWHATPLQDAIIGGHDLCVQILMAAGARLGASASREDHSKVEHLSRSMGFDWGSDRKAFCEKTGALRRWVGSHMRRGRRPESAVSRTQAGCVRMPSHWHSHVRASCLRMLGRPLRTMACMSCAALCALVHTGANFCTLSQQTCARHTHMLRVLHAGVFRAVA